ncbi:MAG: hypothetical protein D3910_28760 [Candidatus Electrothrix sp. ATG2]|nr:hypothetical protein [Candidatus Electrothrix sp. ATG2]
MPNHLDHSLLLYEASGKALGEMKVTISSSDQKQLAWIAAPGATYQTLQQIEKSIVHLGSFLSRLYSQSIETFQDFLRAINETLWTTVPMGAQFGVGSATLNGRPLALVRASVSLELDGPTDQDPSWQYTFQPQIPTILSYTFPIKFGNQAQLTDGLIGYFTQGDYSSLNITREAGAPESSYLKPIGQDDNYIKQTVSGAPTCLSLLIDPRASVHATTGILPVMDITLPAKLVADTLARIRPQFRVNGIMTHQITTAEQEQLVMPAPAFKQVQTAWKWLEKSADNWTTYELKKSDTTAHLSNELPQLRQGILTLFDEKE